MTTKTKRSIGIIILLLILIGGTIGYKMWNKPHRSVENTDGTKVTAQTLYVTYQNDSVSAKKQYTDKVVEVSGTLSKRSTNQQNETILLISTGADGAYINCTMEGKVDDIKEGNSVTIKGICSGYIGGDADMGLPGDVVLVRGYIVK